MPDLLQHASEKWWHRWLLTPAELHSLGVVGINMRNARFMLPYNPRRLYGLVDDKLQTKALALQRAIAVPETYGVIRSPRDAARFERNLEGRSSFVIKPARGSGGRGVLVIDAREGENFIKPSGVSLSRGEVRHHLANILAGLFSLGGQRDNALIEYRVTPARVMMDFSYQGAPDIRIVLFQGYPVMAMVRAATRESDGRANLHQGALGIGIDIATGRTIRAIHHGSSLTRHPDLNKELIGIQLPEWDKILEIAVTCQEMTGLGYLGVDLMIDEISGPLMIEVNARPGLAIQMANGIGLLHRLDAVTAHSQQYPGAGHSQKIQYSKNHFATDVSSAR